MASMKQRRVTGLPGVIALGLALRRARMARGVGLRRLADQLGIHAGLVSAWEYALRVPSVTDVARLLGFLRVKRDEYQQIMNLCQDATRLTLVEPTSNILPPLLWHYETTATKVVVWSPALIPDAFRTVEYTRTLLNNGLLLEDEIDQRSLARAARPDAMIGHPGKYLLLLGEPALSSVATSRQIMIDQLRYLEKLSEHPRITVHIVRGDATVNFVTPFSVFESAKGAVTTIVHQNFHGIVYEASPQYVARHQATAEALRQASATEADSKRLVAATIERMQRCQEP